MNANKVFLTPCKFMNKVPKNGLENFCSFVWKTSALFIGKFLQFFPKHIQNQTYNLSSKLILALNSQF